MNFRAPAERTSIEKTEGVMRAEGNSCPPLPSLACDAGDGQDGQDVYLMDLFNWLRPCNQTMVKFQIRGEELLQMIEGNILGTDARSL